nr:hypothetical protein [uncultured bacterium]
MPIQERTLPCAGSLLIHESLPRPAKSIFPDCRGCCSCGVAAGVLCGIFLGFSTPSIPMGNSGNR